MLAPGAQACEVGSGTLYHCRPPRILGLGPSLRSSCVSEPSEHRAHALGVGEAKEGLQGSFQPLRSTRQDTPPPASVFTNGKWVRGHLEGVVPEVG